MILVKLAFNLYMYETTMNVWALYNVVYLYICYFLACDNTLPVQTIKITANKI